MMLARPRFLTRRSLPLVTLTRVGKGVETSILALAATAIVALIVTCTLGVAPVRAQTPGAVTGDAGADTALEHGLEAAIAQVRAHYFGQDFHEGAVLGRSALGHWPGSPELSAWTVTNLARSDQGEEALERAEALLEAWPEDPWSHIAHAFALAYIGQRGDEALEASLRPLELAPTMPEAVWVRAFVLNNQRKLDEVAPFIDEKWSNLDYAWAELITVKGNAIAAQRYDDREKLEEGLAVLAEARELDPENVNAHFFAASILMSERRLDEAIALFERAVALSPGSSSIANWYWRGIRARQDLDGDEKTARITAAAADLLALRGHHGAALRAVASTYRELGLEVEARELEDRVLREFDETVDAEWVLSDRWRTLARQLREGEVQDSAAARTELRSMWWSFVDRPAHRMKPLLGEAYWNLFSDLSDDLEVSPDTLLLVARGAAEHDRMNPSLRPRLAAGVAERGVHLDEARELALAGLEVAEEFMDERMEMFDTPGEAADYLDWLLAEGHAALAFVETKAGRLDVARETIERALEMKHDNPTVQLYAGALAEAEGDLEAAEIHYGRGYQYERPRLGDHKPNRDALERIYLERHGSMDGYDAFVADLEERDRELRRQRVADSRLEEPRPSPAMDLEWLHGGRITEDDVVGRIVVVNFWGVWCGPCVAEAPQLQQFHERYRDDQAVLFLTVNNDDDPEKVRTWMADKAYDFAVLLDDGFVSSAGVRAFPTTWFIMPDGQIVFEHVGASEVVYEEFTWRVEMMREELASTGG